MAFTVVEYPKSTVNFAINHANEHGDFRHYGISMESLNPQADASVLAQLISVTTNTNAGDHIKVVDAKEFGLPPNSMVSVSSGLFSPPILLHLPASMMPKM